MPVINKLSVSIYVRMLRVKRMKRNLVRGQNYSDLLTVQTKCKSDNAEFYLKLFYIQSKEI